MKLHERTMPVSSAQADLNLMIVRFARERGLTDIELLQGLTDLIQSRLKFMLRAERHPEDPTKEADLE